MSQETIVEDHKLVIRRTFAAPVERVYLAWTDPAQMAQWYAPNPRWNQSRIDVEAVPGGRYDVTMCHPDGDEVRMVGRYGDVLPNKRLSFTLTWLGDTAGEVETLVTVDFRAVPEGTELTFTHDRQIDLEAVKSTSEGWTGFMEMLESYLAGKTPLGSSTAACSRAAA